MSSKPETAEGLQYVPTEWLARTVELLNAMAGEGIGMADCADPADLMCEIGLYFDCGEADDLWGAVTAALSDAAKKAEIRREWSAGV